MSHKPLESKSLETIKYLTLTQLNSLIAIARRHSTRNTAIIQVAYTHGLRISEVGRLQLSDYDVENRRLFITRVKNGPRIQYPTSEDCFKILRLWLKIRRESSGPLFASRHSILGDKNYNGKSRGISKSSIDYFFREYAKEAKFPKDLQHFHVLRHSCAVHMVDRDIPLIQIKDWLGHRNIASTEIYAKVSDMKRNETAGRFFENKEVKEEKERKKNKKEKGVLWGKD